MHGHHTIVGRWWPAELPVAMGTGSLVRKATSAPLTRGCGAVTEGYTGHPDGLLAATRTPLEWAYGQGLEWDVTSTADGDRWGRGWKFIRPTAPT